MRRSELILPLRIYDDVFDQYRFNRNCDIDGCEQALLVSSDSLPFFQFTRPSSLNTPTVMALRNVCSDENGLNYKSVRDEGAENFVPGPATENYWGAIPKTQGYTYDNHVDPPFGFTEEIIRYADCGGVESNISSLLTDMPNTTLTTALAYLQVTNVIGSGLKYRLKIVVSELTIGGGSSFKIKVYNGTNADLLLAEITTPGIHIIEFVSIYPNVTIYFPDIQTGDYFLIKHIQCTCLVPVAVGGFDDVAIDETNIKIIQKNDGTDVVIYCESPITNYAPEPGDYYYVIQFGLAEVYFSEIFRVMRPEDLEQYYKLKWSNGCDINSAVIYTPSLYSSICEGYFNELYLSAELFEPEFETDEEEEENGTGDKNPTFKRWQKSLKLEIAKCPPFLTDALTAVFLHDTVTLCDPLNKLQDIRGDEYEIERVTTEVEDIFNNCFQAVKMKFFLPSRFTKTNCCDAAELFECPDSPPAPTMDVITEVSDNLFIIEGTGVPGSIAVVEYNLNGAGYVTSPFGYAIVDADGDYVITFDADWISDSITDLDVRVNNKTIACGTFGTTASQDII